MFVFAGLFVEIGKNMNAFIPALHMSDVPLKNPEKKFSIGDRLKCRVLRVDPEKKKIHLTAKNILVSEEYPVVSTFDQNHVGKVTEGVVVSLSTEGTIIMGRTHEAITTTLICQYNVVLQESFSNYTEKFEDGCPRGTSVPKVPSSTPKSYFSSAKVSSVKSWMSTVATQK